MQTQLRLEELQIRISKLERQNIQLKRAGTFFLFGCVLLLVSVATRAQDTKVPAVRPVEPRVSVLETRYNSLTLRVNAIQKEISDLVTIATYPTGTLHGSDLDDLRDDVDSLKSKVRDLDDDVTNLKDTVNELKDSPDDLRRVKSDLDDVESHVNDLKIATQSLDTFRSAICSLSWTGNAYTILHTGYPAPCSAF
jgi:uncharacterized protein YlxW (UPF0749 family)